MEELEAKVEELRQKGEDHEAFLAVAENLTKRQEKRLALSEVCVEVSGDNACKALDGRTSMSALARWGYDGCGAILLVCHPAHLYDRSIHLI